MTRLNIMLVRGLSAMGLGVVLTCWSAAAAIYLVMVIGLFFLVPGLYKLYGWFIRRKKIKEEEGYSFFPVDALGGVLFGAWLVFTPSFFIHILMYILGVLLLLAGGQQLLWLFVKQKVVRVGWVFYIIPVLIFLTGIVILAFPFGFAFSVFTLFGIASIVYGVNELINWYKFRPHRELN